MKYAGIILLLALSALLARPVAGADFPYQDARQPVDARVKDLIGRMTLDEKLAQMTQDHMDRVPDDEAKFEEKYKGNMPGFFSAWGHTSLADTAVRFHAIQKYQREKTRLGIPALMGAEAIHGVVAEGATIYPQAIALGSTWNPALVKEMAGQIAAEASAAGITQALSPVLDLGRDPRYGRIEECYGECPTLVSRMGVAFITGMQGDDAQQGLAPDKIYCMGKHFAGYSVPANGINISPVLIGEREMRGLHLVPFEAAVVEAHVMGMMPSYNSVDGVPSHANHWLLTELLRGEWGFKGYIYSDWGGIDPMLLTHRVARNRADAGRVALLAGVDMEASEGRAFPAMKSLIESGQIDPALVDQAVGHILRAKFIAGLFDSDRRDGDPEAVKRIAHIPEHVALARKLAEESITLLKNDDNLLPLNPEKIKSIALIGPNADQVQFGDYCWTKNNRDGVSVARALREECGDKLKVNYAKGCNLTGVETDDFPVALQAARDSDLAIVVIGDTSKILSGVGWEDPTVPASGTVGEGYDTNNPVPPGMQEELVRQVIGIGKPTIVVMLNGRPYCIPWIKEHASAIVEALYPGQEQGHAIVDVLFGKVNPSGHLPVSVARSAGHIPTTYDYKPFGRGNYHNPGSTTKNGQDYVFDTPAPLWPFGFGLSYTSFEISNLKLESKAIPAKDGVLKFSVDVANTGTLAGKTVPQIYWRDLVAQTAPPEKRLLRFSKVALQPGQKQTLLFEVPSSEFWSLTPNKKRVVDPGDIELQVGENAEAKMLTAKCTLK